MVGKEFLSGVNIGNVQGYNEKGSYFSFIFIIY